MAESTNKMIGIKKAQTPAISLNRPTTASIIKWSKSALKRILLR